MSARAGDLIMRTPLVAATLGVMRAEGRDADGLRGRFDLPADVEQQPAVQLPLRTMRAFFDAAEAELGDPDLGLHLAERLERGTYGLVEYVIRSAPTLRVALDRVVQHIGLLNEIVRITYTEKDGIGRVEQSVPGSPLALGRHPNEFFVAAMILHGRRLCGVQWVPERVCLAHAAPDDRRELVRICGTRHIEGGTGANAVEVGAAVLDLPIAGADRPLHALLTAQAEKAEQQRVRSDDVIARARAHVRESFEAGATPTLESLASALRSSPRTLQRRLVTHETTFQALVDSVREEIARVVLRDPSVTLGELSFRLGYSETSAFVRAFRRWTGTTPAAYRRRI